MNPIAAEAVPFLRTLIKVSDPLVSLLLITRVVLPTVFIVKLPDNVPPVRGR